MTRFRTATAEGAAQPRLPTHTLFLLLLALPVATACRKSDSAANDANAAPGEVAPATPPSTKQGVASTATLDLAVRKDREQLLRLYARGMVKTADEALAGRKGKDDACQSETVCHWSRNEALPQLRGAPAARSFRQARYGVSYAKQDPKSFTVHAILPAASGWAQSFSCDLLEHAMPLPGPSSQGPSALFCDITDGPSNGSVFGFQAVGKGPASVTLKSAARSR